MINYQTKIDDWLTGITTGGILVDLRTDEERFEGHIELAETEAIHMDFYDPKSFVDKLKTLDPKDNYYIYCQSGVRGFQACYVFKEYGFENVYNLLGGYKVYLENKNK